MRMHSLIPITVLLIFAALFCACTAQSGEMQDGYYTAKADSFDSDGWKEYVTIYVSDNKILTVDYDAYNSSGLVRSWDINYMRAMKKQTGTYPNEYTRAYSVALINWQSPADVDAISGAEAFHASFVMLAEAAIAQSRSGNKQVILVDISNPATLMNGKG